MIILALLWVLLVPLAIVVDYRDFKRRTGRDPEVDDLIKRIKAERNKKFNDNWTGVMTYNEEDFLV